ncbi:phage gp6-like head-tail connector protein [Micromonospora thermarum]|uniref:Phage gp6-like head-tail connector protein n=1 Tax=Micromonospora thermarum TaxID=2720024 RepID=A0ABX0Z888_9ACTN|nr:phage gp6-like head-tail connector protein [Micromonospora thermarum]NJP33688.1 phage gp6-like head-tail connector protein [Micromonospora thermarum]
MAGLYTTLPLLRHQLKITGVDPVQDEALTQVIEASSRGIDDHPPGRPPGAFLPPTGVTTRELYTRGRLVREGCDHLLLLGSMHEIATAGDLLVEIRSGETWRTFTGWEIEPPDPGDPITVLRARVWPRDALLRITARYGWPALPGKIAQAALIQSMRLAKRPDTPEGVAGSAEWGGVIRMARLDPDVAALVESVTGPGFA